LEAEFVPTLRTWKVGESIDLSVHEFSQVLQSVMFFGRETVQRVVAFMKSQIPGAVSDPQIPACDTNAPPDRRASGDA
jgi:hypothetical protein